MHEGLLWRKLKPTKKRGAVLEGSPVLLRWRELTESVRRATYHLAPLFHPPPSVSLFPIAPTEVQISAGGGYIGQEVALAVTTEHQPVPAYAVVESGGENGSRSVFTVQQKRFLLMEECLPDSIGARGQSAAVYNKTKWDLYCELFLGVGAGQSCEY